MKLRYLGTWAKLKITVVPLAVSVGSIGLWIVLVIFAGAVLQLPTGPALVASLLCVILHWFSETVHQLGHARAARRTGYPMIGIRFGTYGILSTAVYPRDEVPLPANTHIRRALGGPLFSAWLTCIAFVVLLAIIRSASPAALFVAWFFFLENLFIMTLQVFVPLGFNDGATIWHWLRQRS